MIDTIISQELREKVGKLFDKSHDSCIKSCIQGVMGELYAYKSDEQSEYTAAVAIMGDFAFYAGEAVRELIEYKPNSDSHFIIMVPDSKDKEALIEECYEGRYKKATRYSIKPDAKFDANNLRRLEAMLPDGYELKLIDEEVYNFCLQPGNEWCRDWVSNYSNYEDYKSKGLGVAVIKDGAPVAGTSAYSAYNEGIEIEINTNEAYRRQGLATSAAARLILECLKRGLYPNWDAANLMSVGLSQKLGYEFEKEYLAYHVNW